LQKFLTKCNWPTSAPFTTLTINEKDDEEEKDCQWSCELAKCWEKTLNKLKINSTYWNEATVRLFLNHFVELITGPELSFSVETQIEIGQLKGPVDYLFYHNDQIVGVLEAKDYLANPGTVTFTRAEIQIKLQMMSLLNPKKFMHSLDSPSIFGILSCVTIWAFYTLDEYGYFIRHATINIKDFTNFDSIIQHFIKVKNYSNCLREYLEYFEETIRNNNEKNQDESLF